MALKEEQEEQEVALIFLWRGRRRWRGGRRWRVSEHEDLSTDDTKTRQPITHTHTHTHTHRHTQRQTHTHREKEGGRGRKREEEGGRASLSDSNRWESISVSG